MKIVMNVRTEHVGSQPLILAVGLLAARAAALRSSGARARFAMPANAAPGPVP
jgi:hypothetical protein